jgi:hypothetical protein
VVVVLVLKLELVQLELLMKDLPEAMQDKPQESVVVVVELLQSASMVQLLTPEMVEQEFLAL